jgi:hypothetical protein
LVELSDETMDKIKLVPQLENNTEKKGYELRFRLMINGEVYYGVGDVDLRQFQASMRQDGNYFIMTCDCGFPGCAGYDKGIRVTNDGIRYRWVDKDFPEYPAREFRITEYRQAWSDFIKRLKFQLKEIDPASVRVVPSTNCEILAQITGKSGWI